ncbi:MAG: YbjQ family protein [Eubacterium sp.]|nr:YbjQ family protein [Eubacterium sp.]
MLIVTSNDIPGKQFEVLGLVQGSTVQTVNALRDIGAGLKNLVGGELKKYNEMMAKSRDLALSRMTEQAQGMGADAVIAMRYASSELSEGAAEMMAYGTAVKFM